MEEYKSRAAFLRTLGVQCTNTQGQYSFANHDAKRVFFGLDQRNSVSHTLILGDNWMYLDSLKKDGTPRKNPTYTKSKPHIELIEKHGYELWVFKTTTTVDLDGKVHATNLFDPNIELRKLVRKYDGYHAEKY